MMNARHRQRIICNVCNVKEASKYCFDCGATMCERCLTSVTIPIYVCLSCGEKYSGDMGNECPHCGSTARNVEKVVTKLKCAVCGSENIEDLDALFSKYPSTVMKTLEMLKEPFSQLTKIGSSITTHALHLESIRENGINSCGIIEEKLKEIREQLITAVKKFEKLVRQLRKDVLFPLDNLNYFHNLTIDKLGVADSQVKLIKVNVERLIARINGDIEILKKRLESLTPYVNFLAKQNQLYLTLPMEIQTRLPTEPMIAILGPLKGKVWNAKRSIGKQFYVIFTFNKIHVISAKGEIMVLEFFKDLRVRKEKPLIGGTSIILESSNFTIKIKEDNYNLNQIYEEINFILSREANQYVSVIESKNLVHSPVEISQPLMSATTTLDELFRYIERKLYQPGLGAGFRYNSSKYYPQYPPYPQQPQYQERTSPYRNTPYADPFITADKIERIKSELYSVNKSIETLKSTMKHQTNPSQELISKIQDLYRKRFQLLKLLEKFGYKSKRLFGNKQEYHPPEFWDDYDASEYGDDDGKNNGNNHDDEYYNGKRKPKDDDFPPYSGYYS